MPNSNNYIAFDLDNVICQEFYDIGQNIFAKLENFSPFELNQVHMTVCFLGELSKKIKTNKKETFENLLTEIHDFPPICTLEFDSYQLFGSKNNLVVAKFKMSKADEKKIIDLKKYYTDKFQAPKENYYTPHITLGKILNMNGENKIDLDSLNLPKPSNLKLGSISMKLV